MFINIHPICSMYRVFTYIWLKKYSKCIGKYSSPMEPMGIPHPNCIQSEPSVVLRSHNSMPPTTGQIQRIACAFQVENFPKKQQQQLCKKTSTEICGLVLFSFIHFFFLRCSCLICVKLNYFVFSCQHIILIEPLV